MYRLVLSYFGCCCTRRVVHGTIVRDDTIKKRYPCVRLRVLREYTTPRKYRYTYRLGGCSRFSTALAAFFSNHPHKLQKKFYKKKLKIAGVDRFLNFEISKNDDFRKTNDVYR